MISLEGIEKIQSTAKNKPIHTLKGITLSIAEGEIFGILGRKGAGKSALIRCFNLLERPTRGAIVVDSSDLTTLNTEALRQARRKIGMVFQHFNLLSSRTVFENVALPLEIIKMPKNELEETVNTCLSLAGITDLANAYPNHLTPGQKQRVAIARALVNRPKVLLCEEATASLDSKTTQAILNLLNDINERLHLTLVIITHEIEVIKSLCHRAAILHQGEIVEQGSVFELFTHPKSDIAKEFVKINTRLEMPVALRRRLRATRTEHNHPVFRLSFIGQTAKEPLMAYVIQQFGLTVNILQAHIESLQGQSMGVMIIEVMGEKESIQKAVDFMEHKGLHIEVLGYAS